MLFVKPNVDFWNSYLDSKDFCPNVDVELDEDDDWSFKDIVEIPDEVLSQQRNRRRLLAIPVLTNNKQSHLRK